MTETPRVEFDTDKQIAVIEFLVDGYSLNGRLTREYIDDHVRGNRDQQAMEDYVREHSDELRNALIAKARASTPDEIAGKLPYVAFARRPFDEVDFISARKK